MQNWSGKDIAVVCRLVRSVNASTGLHTYNITIVTDRQDIPMEDLEDDFQVQQAFYHEDKPELCKQYCPECYYSC